MNPLKPTIYQNLAQNCNGWALGVSGCSLSSTLLSQINTDEYTK